MNKIKMNDLADTQVKEVFENFVIAAKAKGLSDVTIKKYHGHLISIGKYLDIEQPLSCLSKMQLNEMVVSMRGSGLAQNSMSSYVRVMRTFLNWCNEEGISDLSMESIKEIETIKPTYTDEELEKLLRKPKKNSGFCEYRNWTIINFLLNSGCRASTIRNIRNYDVDIAAKQVSFRHTKNKRVQIIPLCNLMCSILADYMSIRKGEPQDFLFCNQYGEQLFENALRLAIAHYNRSRGVKKTSIHLFRHTFARKYLIDCGGDAFTLQKILGHSTLKMTKHYCAIYDTDIANNYEQLSPLANMKHKGERIRV